MSAYLHTFLSFFPGTKVWKKRKKLNQLRQRLLAQGQNVSSLNDEQLEFVALEVRKQVLKTAPAEKEAKKAS
jgi:hypothetical protein